MCSYQSFNDAPKVARVAADLPPVSVPVGDSEAAILCKSTCGLKVDALTERAIIRYHELSQSAPNHQPTYSLLPVSPNFRLISTIPLIVAALLAASVSAASGRSR